MNLAGWAGYFHPDHRYTKSLVCPFLQRYPLRASLRTAGWHPPLNSVAVSQERFALLRDNARMLTPCLPGGSGPERTLPPDFAG